MQARATSLLLLQRQPISSLSLYQCSLKFYDFSRRGPGAYYSAPFLSSPKFHHLFRISTWWPTSVTPMSKSGGTTVLSSWYVRHYYLFYRIIPSFMVSYHLEPSIFTDKEAPSHLIITSTILVSLRIAEALRHITGYDGWIYHISKRSKRYGRHILQQYNVWWLCHAWAVVIYFLQSSTHNKLLHSYNRQRGSNSSISIQIPWYASIFVRQWILVVDIRRQTILLSSPNAFEIFRDKWTTITWCSLHVSFDIYPGISYSIRLLLLEISDSISTILTYIRRMQKDIVGFALVQLELAVYTSRRSCIY